jgi:hypothetical protein
MRGETMKQYDKVMHQEAQETIELARKLLDDYLITARQYDILVEPAICLQAKIEIKYAQPAL